MSPAPVTPTILHAGLICAWRKGRWQGVLIVGPSGSGKSQLALSALSQGWRLVADDRVLVWTDGDQVYGRSPQPLSGLIEVRGLGVVAAPSPVRAFCTIDLVVHLTGATPIERLPDRRVETVAGQPIARFDLDGFSTHSLASLALALERLPVRP